MINFIKSDVLNSCSSSELYDSSLLDEHNWRSEPKLSTGTADKLKLFVQDGTITNTQRKQFLRQVKSILVIQKTLWTSVLLK